MLWPKSGKPIPNPSLILGNENGMDFECSIRSQLQWCPDFAHLVRHRQKVL